MITWRTGTQAGVKVVFGRFRLTGSYDLTVFGVELKFAWFGHVLGKYELPAMVMVHLGPFSLDLEYTRTEPYATYRSAG